MKKSFTRQFLFAIPVLLGFTEMHAQSAKPGINMSDMDQSVKPNNDFYRFVNGKWLENTPIPADRTRWGTFDELRQASDRDMLIILKDAAFNPKYKSDTDQGKAVNLFKTVMDTVSRNKNGIAPFQPKLAKINAIKNVKDLQKVLTEEEHTVESGFSASL